MRYPSFLPDGGTIGLIAPSFGCTTEPYHTAFLSALESFEEMGYKVSLGPNCFEDCGIGISNTPEACAAEFMDYYCRQPADVLLSCGGGEDMCEILPFLDLDAIRRADPKWFMGFSDNTNLAFLLACACDTAAIYGPNAPAFGMDPWHPSIDHAMELLTGRRLTVEGYDLFERESQKDEENPLAPYFVTEPVRRIRIPKGNHTFSGRLLGGCLDCLINLAGTRFDMVQDFLSRYEEDGVIWFLEACDLNVFGIRRALWQLREAGWFRTAKGFLIGRAKNGEELFGLDHIKAAADILEPLGVPLILDLDIGHLPPMMPLIEGAFAAVRTRGNRIKIQMKLV